jgi:pilus assembly protein CpaE
MSVINPNETGKSWRTHRRDATVQLYLTGAHGDAAELVGARIAGFPLALSLLAESDWIDPEDLALAAAAVIQVDRDSPASVRRFQKLALATKTPLIAAAYEPPLAFVRSLVRAGAHDVVPLPLDVEDLEASLAPIRDELAAHGPSITGAIGKQVSVIKSVGGVGATALLCQLAIQFAEKEAKAGREACLLDLDIQFGDAAFQLGLRPKLSLGDLLDAGSRLDGDLLRATTTLHPSGLHVISSPPEMMPLEGLSSEHLIEIVDLAAREFGTVFVELPTNWTNWSLSLLARSDLVLLVTELSVTSLHRARRQLDLIAAQDLSGLDVRIVVNRFEKGLFKAIKPADVRQALGRDVTYTIANDYAVMCAAAEQGVPLSTIKRRSAVGKDIELLDAGVAATLRLDR